MKSYSQLSWYSDWEDNVRFLLWVNKAFSNLKWIFFPSLTRDLAFNTTVLVRDNDDMVLQMNKNLRERKQKVPHNYHMTGYIKSFTDSITELPHDIGDKAIKDTKSPTGKNRNRELLMSG